MKETFAFHIMALYRDFLSYTTGELKALGISFGQMPFLLYAGNHPGCTQADLTRVLRLDWGYSQRSITKLVDGGFLKKEYSGEKACNCLTLTPKGREVFDTSHAVFQAWDRCRAAGLTPEEQETLLALLTKLTTDRKGSL